jgi:hypothetical protein
MGSDEPCTTGNERAHGVTPHLARNTLYLAEGWYSIEAGRLGQRQPDPTHGFTSPVDPVRLIVGKSDRSGIVTGLDPKLLGTKGGLAVENQPTADVRQTRITEFMKLLPLTAELAGLPKGDPQRPFTVDQLEGRAMTLRSAYKVARNLLREIAEQGA